MTAGPDRELHDEERLMALLALTSQELSDGAQAADCDMSKLNLRQLSPAQLQAMHRYLDAHPDAFAEFLQRHANPAAVTRPMRKSWLSWLREAPFPPLRYALAIGAAAVCVAFVAVQLLDSKPQLMVELDSGYAELISHSAPGALSGSVPYHSDDTAQLGFSADTGSLSALEQSFTAGLLAGAQRLSTRDAAASVDASAVPPGVLAGYYALGQWNALLSSAAQAKPPLPASFWQRQQAFHDRLIENPVLGSSADNLTRMHLQRMDRMLSALTQENRSARPLHSLSEELSLYRDQFASHNEPQPR